MEQPTIRLRSTAVPRAAYERGRALAAQQGTTIGAVLADLFIEWVQEADEAAPPVLAPSTGGDGDAAPTPAEWRRVLDYVAHHRDEWNEWRTKNRTGPVRTDADRAQVYAWYLDVSGN